MTTSGRGGGFLPLLFLVLVAPAFALGLLTGAGPAAIVGAFAGLFGFLTAVGGPLWSDLGTLARFAPLLLVAGAGPRWLAEFSRPAAFALILVLIAVAALLPLRRAGLATAGLGLGMLALFGYGVPIGGDVGAVRLTVATLTGLVVAAAFRLLIGVADPHEPTREAVAGLFDRPDATVSAAAERWLDDGRHRWLGTALEAASRYRIALTGAESITRRLPEALRTDAESTLDELRAAGGRVADRIRAKEPGTTDLPAVPDGIDAQLRERVEQADAALRRARDAAAERDDSAVALPERGLRGLRRALVPGGLHRRSAQVRHALRTVVGVLLALLITLALPQGDPLVLTFLLATYSILQTSWSATLDRARPKIVGLVAGSVVVALILLLAPSALGAPIACVALVVGLWNITTRPVLGNAAIVCVSVGMNSAMRDLAPGPVLVEYAVLVVAAVIIGVVVGFVVVPGLRPPPLRRRLDDAVGATVTAIRTLLDHRRTPGTSGERVATGWRDAERARQELVPDHDALDGGQTAALDRVRSGLGELTALVALTDRDGSDDAEIAAAVDRLERGTATDDGSPLSALADEIHRDLRSLTSAPALRA